MDLQFERAQFDGPAAEWGCQVCKTPLFASYFEVNGHTVCERCCYQLRDATPVGSRAGRVVRAAAAGAGAALAGAILYWAILAATGYAFGLIAIVVGFAVGKAVHWGSRGRGGWAYQTLAMGLTYLAIVSGYVPMIVSEIMKEKPAAQIQATEQGGRAAVAVPVAHAEGDSPAPATPAADTTTQAAPAQEKPAGLGTILLAFGALLLVACAAPFLAGLENIIGLVIIGIGVYEAWKLNRRVPLVITGPHAIALSGAAPIA
jgi:hypothetical protein